MTAPHESTSARPRCVVVYFDGVCNLCNHFVDFLIERDEERRLRYASQQGPGFAGVEARHPELRQVQTVVVVVTEGERETVYSRSAASLAALAELPGGWRTLAVCLWVVPAPVRDFFYDLIAKNRYALFGKRETCRLPTAEERALFVE